MRNVVIVESSMALRTGLSHLLSNSDHFYVSADLSHHDVLTTPFDWEPIDVLLLGPSDIKNPNDQFAGVAIASEYRQARKVGQGRLIALSEMAKNDHLRRRLWEAKVDALETVSDICSLRHLEQLISGDIESALLFKPNESETARSIGIHAGSRINHFVATAQTIGPDYLSAHPPSGAPNPRSRWWGHLRSTLAAAGRIKAVNRDGSMPDREQDVPSIAQLRRVYEWSTVL